MLEYLDAVDKKKNMTHLAHNCLALRHPTQNLNGEFLRSWKQLEDTIIPD